MREPMDDTQRARNFWDREISTPTHAGWLEDPRVRDYANRMIGGGEPLWPLDWFQRHLGGRTFERALSIGCGTGALERDLLQRNVCSSIDAFDGSINSLAVAAGEAHRLGLSFRVRYFAADFNRIELPRGRYDAVFFHQSLHHVGKLERLLRQVLHALKPDGVLFLDEYIGPSSTAWTPDLAKHHRDAWSLVPQDARRFDELPYPIAPDDPSEAIRSGEILRQLSIGFEPEALRPYGGNVLSAVYGQVDWSRAPESLLDQLIVRDAGAVVAGETSYYAIIVARPKQGLAKTAASLRWYIEPKVKRIARELKGKSG